VRYALDRYDRREGGCGVRSVNVAEAVGGMRDGKSEEWAGTSKTRRDGATYQLKSLLAR